MKLKQLAKTFLKVGKIINIILIPLFALLLLIFLIVDIVGIATLNADGADAETISVAVSALIMMVVTYTILIAVCVAALILNTKAGNIFATAQSKQEAKKGAIMAIVAGALITTFPIVSGILMLCTKEEDWGKEQPAEEAKAE